MSMLTVNYDRSITGLGVEPDRGLCGRTLEKYIRSGNSPVPSDPEECIVEPIVFYSQGPLGQSFV